MQRKFKCKDCYNIHNSVKVATDEVDEWYECPTCGSDEIVEVYQCADCGDWYEDDELSVGDLCSACLREKAKDEETVIAYAEDKNDVKGLVENVLSATEITNILLSAMREKLKLLHRGNEALTEYALEDKDRFGAYISALMA